MTKVGHQTGNYKAITHKNMWGDTTAIPNSMFPGRTIDRSKQSNR